ncbi:tyrosine-type recombinase/integrase [Alteribacillus sp. YIM 98480]|uniref:tyrosine-type recombinase/integrase n=1 Tax=Alteribacillus sp. YIM 98480 TaxID=2606599 RepID=UPI00131D0B40|nr:tyrosine-type recombinase/integrase [Alteribacillus sp. YIM 98480]
MLDEFHTYIQGKSDNTIRTYLQRVSKFIDWLSEQYGEDDPTNVTALDLKEFQKQLKGSASTVSQYMFAVRCYCDFLYERGYIEKDISKSVRVKKESKATAPKTLSKNEFNKFRRMIHSTDNPLYIAIIELLMATGIRVHECTSLTVDDVTLSQRKGSIKIQGKGIKERVIPLNNDARKAISNYLLYRRETDSDKLFIGQRGAMSDDGVRKLIDRYRKKAGIKKKVTPHMLRHQLATELIRNKKKDLVMVKDILGHSNINTLYVYSKSTEEEQAEALEDLYE